LRRGIAPNCAAYDARTSPDVRKKFHGHHVAFGVVPPQWQFSIMIARPEAFIRLAHRSRSRCAPQPSSFTESKPNSMSAATSPW